MCPCHSRKFYDLCCKPLHNGVLPAANAVSLMRSRYSAYARGLASYIIKTTHPLNSLFKQKEQDRIAGIIQFCQETSFDGLEILEHIDGQNESYVTFRATLSQNGKDISFTEKSLFKKENGLWLYVAAV